MSDYLESILSSGLATFIAVSLFIRSYIRRKEIAAMEALEGEKEYFASCHCKNVVFSLRAPRHLVAWNCNCSICFMKKNWHLIIPSNQFKLDPQSKQYLTEYKFNTMTATHTFCKVCGVQAYYIPRSNPDGVAVTLACIPPEQVESFEIRDYDGRNWESFYGKSNISQFSKSK